LAKVFSEGRWTHDYPIAFVEAKAKNKQMEGGVPLLPYLKKFERIIVIALIVMMAFVILLATIELGWLIIKDMITPPYVLLEIDELLDIFGLFLLVLLGIELISTLRTYLTENEVHVEVVFVVALIAIGRKVIILDVKELSSLTLIGIASIIIALSLGYFFIKKPIQRNGPPEEQKGNQDN